MVYIDWNKFKVNHPDSQKAFEELCYYLFCREFKLYRGITTYHNQPGIECEPIMIKHNGVIKLAGFQSKFFEGRIDSKQIEDSIQKALDGRYPDLKLIYIYLNLPTRRTQNYFHNKIEQLATSKQCEVKWITQAEIDNQLINNLDLAELFFDIGNLGGFLGSNLNKKQVSQVKAEEYLELYFNNKNGQKTYTHIKNCNSKIICLKGIAGCGKSLLMTKLCLDLQPNINNVSQEIIVPFLIKLKNCYSQNLTEYIFLKQQRYGLNPKNKIKYVYLFDGLDELSEDRCEDILNEIEILSQDKFIEKMYISSRTSSVNLIFFEKMFENIDYFLINPLNYEDIKTYFKNKFDTNKQNSLERFQEKDLINIRDPFLLNIFWTEIEIINPKEIDITLLDKYVETLLSEKEHQKNLNKLNLLDPKKEEIININKEIAWHLQETFKFNITLNEVQEIVRHKYPNLSFKETNDIINHIANCFFDSNDNILTYSHRRLQEFFFLRKLKTLFEKDMSILRKTNVLINFEFMETLFLPYLKRSYLKSNDLKTYLLVKSIESYYSTHWAGKGGEYIFDRIDKIASLIADLDDKEFNHQISEDNPLLIKNFFESRENLNYNLIEIFYRHNKDDYADILTEKLEQQKHQIKSELSKSTDYKLKDLLKKKSEVSWYSYFRLRISKGDGFKPLLKVLRERDFNKEAYKAFFKSLFDLNKDVTEMFKNLKGDEITVFLEVAVSIDYVISFFKDALLRTEVETCIKKQKINKKTNVVYLLLVKILGIIDLSPLNKHFEEKIKELGSKRLIDITNPFSTDLRDYCIFNYLIDKHTDMKYVSVLELFSLLFTNYLQLLAGTTTLRKSIHILQKMHLTDKRNINFLIRDISKIIAKHFLVSQKENNVILLRNRLFKFEIINKFLFYLDIFEKDKEFAKKIIDINDLIEIEEKIKGYDDYSEILENNIDLAKLYLLFNFNKSIALFREGLNNSMVRYGWRKDIFLNHLVDNFNDLLSKNWLSQRQIEEIGDKILLSSKEVLKHIDGKGTNWAPDYLLKYICQYNIEICEKLFKKHANLVSKNNVLGDILTYKAKVSYTSEQIEKELNQITKNYSYDGKIIEDYFVNRFRVYLELTNNESYGINEQKEFFEKAYNEIEALNDKKFSFGVHYENDVLKDLSTNYGHVCKKYGKKFNLILTREDTLIKEKKIEIEPKESIIKAIKEANKTHLKNAFDEMKINIECISDKNCWKLLIDTSLNLTGDINLILEFLEDRWYSSVLHYDSYSKFDYLVVKQIFLNVKAKKLFLERSLSSERLVSYPALLKVIISLNDRTNAVDIFNDYLKFCDFLIGI